MLGRYKAWEWLDSPAWREFTGTLAEPYGVLFVKHDELFRDRDLVALVDWLRRLPENGPALIDECIVEGVSVDVLLGLRVTKSRDLQRAIEVALRVHAAFRSVGGVTLGPDYVPPAIEIPDGWRFADAVTYPGLSAMYNCYISTHGYGRHVAEGRAHIFYRDDVPDGGGALCFAVTGGRGWYISEIRSYDNEDVQRAFVAQAQEIIDALNRNYPGPHAGCRQTNTLDDAMRIALMGLSSVVERRIALAVAAAAA